MAPIVLKTANRKTLIPRNKVRKAVAASYSKSDAELNDTDVVIRVTKKPSSKVTAKSS